MFAKFDLVHCLILFVFACLKFDLCLFAQIILLVAFNYFDKPQKYLFKNTILKILHKGAKQTFMYYVFISLSKLFYFKT